MFRKALLFCVLFLFIPTVLALRTCDHPTVHPIRESKTFCGRNYYLTNGISIESDNVTIDCGNAVLQGTIIHGRFNGTGISIINRKNVTLKNCRIALYETGILVKNSTEITVIDSSLIRNRIGIKLYNAHNNFFERNHDISISHPVKNTNSNNNIFSYSNKKVFGGFCKTNFCNKQSRIAEEHEKIEEQQQKKRSLRRVLKASIKKFVST